MGIWGPNSHSIVPGARPSGSSAWASAGKCTTCQSSSRLQQPRGKVIFVESVITRICTAPGRNSRPRGTVKPLPDIFSDSRREGVVTRPYGVVDPKRVDSQA